MKFKEFNQSNSKMAAPGEPTVRINSTAGLFSFSKAAAVLMGFSQETKVVFVQDEDQPSDWYIKTCTSDSAFAMRSADDSREYSFNCTALGKQILSTVKAPKPIETIKAAGFKISKVPVEFENEKYWCIITINPLTPR